MKAGVVHARDDIRYEDIEKPVPKEKQVLIKVKYTGSMGMRATFSPMCWGMSFQGR